MGRTASQQSDVAGEMDFRRRLRSAVPAVPPGRTSVQTVFPLAGNFVEQDACNLLCFVLKVNRESKQNNSKPRKEIEQNKHEYGSRTAMRF